MSIDISQFYQVFFDEAEELLAEMERLLLGVAVGFPPELPRCEHGVAGDDEERHRGDQREPSGPQQEPHASTVGNAAAACARACPRCAENAGSPSRK